MHLSELLLWTVSVPFQANSSTTPCCHLIHKNFNCSLLVKALFTILNHNRLAGEKRD